MRAAVEQLYSTHPAIAMKLYFMIMGVVLAQFVEESKEPSRHSFKNRNDAVTDDISGLQFLCASLSWCLYKCRLQRTRVAWIAFTGCSQAEGIGNSCDPQIV